MKFSAPISWMSHPTFTIPLLRTSPELTLPLPTKQLVQQIPAKETSLMICYQVNSQPYSNHLYHNVSVNNYQIGSIVCPAKVDEPVFNPFDNILEFIPAPNVYEHRCPKGMLEICCLNELDIFGNASACKLCKLRLSCPFFVNKK